MSKVCVVTMVYEEYQMLPLWLRHYGGLFGLENLVVIDNGSSKEFRDTIPNECQRILLPRQDLFSDTSRAKSVSDLCSALHRYYDFVIYSDCDELVVHNPFSCGNIFQALQLIEGPCDRCVGFEVVQISSRGEGAIRLDEAILNPAQRQYVIFKDSMCKPLVSRAPVKYGGGFHSVNCKAPLSGNFILFHLRDVDQSLRVEKQNRTRNISRFNNSTETGPAPHWKWESEDVGNHFKRIERRPVSEMSPEILNYIIKNSNMNIVNIEGDPKRDAMFAVRMRESGGDSKGLYKLPEAFHLLI